MISDLITLLVVLVIGGLLWYLVANVLPLPKPFGIVAQVLVILILILVLIHYFLPAVR